MAMEIFEITRKFPVEEKYEEVGRMLNHMIENPDKYRPRH